MTSHRGLTSHRGRRARSTGPYWVAATALGVVMAGAAFLVTGGHASAAHSPAVAGSPAAQAPAAVTGAAAAATGAPAAPVAQPAAAAGAPQARQPATGGAVYLEGDSLTVGIESLLPALVPGRTLTVDAQVGRTTETGLAHLQQLAARGRLPSTLVVGLGTNDAPDPVAYRQAVQDVLTLAGPDRWVVWVNVSRPANAVGSWTSFNTVLDELAAANPNMVVVDWAGAVAHGSGMAIADRVHGTDYGYAVRAQLVADAIRAH